MKKLFAVAMLLGAVATTAAVAKGGAEEAVEVDLEQVNARLDARLHVLLAAQLAKHP